MRPWLLTALLLATTLAGCFDDIPEGPALDTPEPDPEPTTGLRPGNATLYLHSDGGTHWMDADADATSTALTGNGGAAIEPQRIRFDLRPAPERDLVLGGPVRVALTANIDPLVGEAPHFEFSLLVDGSVVATATDNNPRAHLESPDWPAGAAVALEVCVCPSGASITYGYTLRTDGSSTVTLDFGDDDGAAPPATGNATPDGGQGEPQQGPVTVAQENGRWVARRTDTYQESTSATKADIDLAVPVGDVQVQPGGSGSKLVINLGARGDTEQEARTNLSAMTVQYAANTASGVFQLDASVRTANQQWSNQWAHMTLTLSPTDLVALKIDTSTGDMDIGSFTGDAWNLDTSTGDIALLDFTVDKLAIDSSTGDVTLRGTVSDLLVDTSTGDVNADIQATASGPWSIDTSTGDIRIRAPEDANRGYDATADTSTGDITFTFSDASPVGEQDDDHKHVRTNGYDGRSIQTVLTLGTSTADIRAGSS